MSHITDLAWAAGIIDGEGCILAYETKAGCALRLTVRMVHKPTVIRLCTLFGGKVKRCPTKHRMAWEWMRAGQQAAYILKQLQPYMVTKAEESYHLRVLAQEQQMRGNRPAPRTWQRARISRMKNLKRKEWK